MVSKSFTKESVTNSLFLFLTKHRFLTKTLLLQADDFTDLKSVYSIYIAWILNPTFFRPILVTLTKLATKRFVKLFVDVNRSISEQTIYFATDIDVGWLDVFLIQSKQKNRKPEPAVGVI